MKNTYKLLGYIIVINYIVVSVLAQIEIQIVSLIPKVLALLVFFAPVEILFWCLGRDEAKNPRVRGIFKFLFWFIVVCFGMGFAIELLEVFYGQL